jgi:hypothetical protein
MATGTASKGQKVSYDVVTTARGRAVAGHLTVG